MDEPGIPVFDRFGRRQRAEIAGSQTHQEQCGQDTQRLHRSNLLAARRRCLPSIRELGDAPEHTVADQPVDSVSVQRIRLSAIPIPQLPTRAISVAASLLARGSLPVRKALEQPFPAIAKDPGQIRRHQPPVDQPASPDRVPHMIFDQRASLHRAEAVLVNPSAIGTPDLFVHKETGGIPGRDAAPPTQGNSTEPEPVVDFRACLDGDRYGIEDLKVQPGRGEQIQVSCIREEGKNLLRPPPDQDRAVQFE